MAEHYPVSFLETQSQYLFDARRGLNPETEKFIAALAVEMPYLKFRSAKSWDGNEIAVYREGDALAMGWIGYGDYTPSERVHKRYTVYSPSITNGKYKTDSDAHHMAMTEDLGKAIKLVKKHLRPIPILEVANYSTFEVNHAFSEAHKSTRQMLDTARRAIVGSSGDIFINKSLENALAQLRMVGHEIGDKDFNQHVDNYFAHKNVYAEALNFSGSMYFVHPQMKFGEPVYNVLPMTWGRSVSHALPRFRAVDGLSAAYLEAMDTDMETIKDRVAALYLMQNKDFVVGVGMKVDAARYFVVV
jgi:hypothetical protein